MKNDVLTLASESSHPKPPLLTSEQCARMCGISRRTWHRLSASAKVPSPVKIGGNVRWRSSDMELFLEWNCPSREEFEQRKEALNAQ
ncbi:putative transcriptional regulator [Anaerohalosphaera lusitana]|uniref:Putative transcriptional regulator n=1 Tax=Anaerohalosphaera lusitana TaxID=1936003 RepID=A0A1U9NLG2_9BACT|nr:helix-turn-helix domain-containing protein [Anaerohalosphaera lusitana]AQT68782.1 putative transcriptional regulator [Anaerohalosphaera lusitana]